METQAKQAERERAEIRDFTDPFAAQRELSISAPPPAPGSSADPIPSVYRSQLDAPMRVRVPLPIALALLFHGTIFVLAFVLPKLQEHPQLRKPLIASLIIKGKPRDPRLMPRLAPTSSAASRSMEAPPSRKPSDPPAQNKPPQPRTRQPSREELMERALAQATRGVEQDRHEIKPEEREGSETGSDDGNSTNAEEGDQYFAAVQAAILSNYVLPSIISERERMSLKATVDAWIARDGTIVKYQFEQRSGNRFFDDALELAIKRTKVPPPPADRAAGIARDGVALVFTP